MERGTDRVKALRAAFLAHRPKLDPARTFFIDETGSTTAMARDYALYRPGPIATLLTAA